MANITFNLKEPKKNGRSLIFIVLRIGNQKIKLSTGEKVDTGMWNPKKQRAKTSRGFPELTELNSILDMYESSFREELYQLKKEQLYPSKDVLKDLLQTILRGKEEEEIHRRPDLISFAQYLISSTSRKANTIKNYKQAVVKMLDFQKAKRRKLSYDVINMDFYNEFMRYMNKKGYSTNTTGTIIKNIKVFMNEAYDRGYHTNRDYLSRKFKVIEEVTDSIYLNEQEIKEMYELDLSRYEHLDRARDLFIVGAYTGLRFSDLSRLSDKNFESQGKLLRVRTQKTNEDVVIPVHPFVRTIFDKYLGEFPTQITNQKFNAFIKEVAMITKIDSLETVRITKGGENVESSVPKYNLVTAHTARRSFATNLYLQDVPSITIMKVTGHKTEKAFLKYIRISKEENAKRLLGHKFFGG
jgi:integrase